MTGYRASYANVDANRQQMLAGIQLLQQGDFARARQTFENLLAAGARDAGVLTALAMACRGDHAPDAALAAVSEALSLDPSNPRGLLLRGDLAADAGDPRSASAYYQGAIESARGIEALPADLNRQLQQAASYCDRQARAIDALIESELASHEGLVPGPRFRESIDILMGRKPIRVQQPRFFYFPGLANITFFDRSRFGFLDALEAQTDAIREELLAVMRDERVFEPYVRRDPARPAKNQQDIVDNPAWSAYYLW
ncbi:MAG TPA: hypothetical protein VFV17_07225, partial [Usitatibacteraceae bacterium]|nr:hypothetical protein [Usitatibacteraceae bacterium]